MQRVAILHSTKSGEKEKIIHSLAGAFQKKKCQVNVKKSAEAAITDILAADIVILGSEGDGPVDPAFGEIRRALNGVNLAGRVVGLLDFGNASAADFRAALEDTDIDIFADELNMDGIGVKEIKKWAADVDGKYKEISRAGKI